eukprot:6746565-Pyramimonas_sp.AAC.1
MQPRRRHCRRILKSRGRVWKRFVCAPKEFSWDEGAVTWWADVVGFGRGIVAWGAPGYRGLMGWGCRDLLG